MASIHRFSSFSDYKAQDIDIGNLSIFARVRAGTDNRRHSGRKTEFINIFLIMLKSFKNYRNWRMLVKYARTLIIFNVRQ